MHLYHYSSPYRHPCCHPQNIVDLPFIYKSTNHSSPPTSSLSYWSLILTGLHLIRFFQIEQRGRELYCWEEMIEKAVDAETKAGLQPTSYIRKMDQRCQRGNRPAHVTAAKAQAQGSSMKDPRVEEPKPGPRESKATNPQPPESAETSEKARMEKKKKKWQKEKRDKKDATTPATGANASNVSAPKE